MPSYKVYGTLTEQAIYSRTNLQGDDLVAHFAALYGPLDRVSYHWDYPHTNEVFYHFRDRDVCVY